MVRLVRQVGRVGTDRDTFSRGCKSCQFVQLFLFTVVIISQTVPALQSLSPGCVRAAWVSRDGRGEDMYAPLRRVGEDLIKQQQRGQVPPAYLEYQFLVCDV